MKLLVLIMGSRELMYPHLSENGVFATWGKLHIPNVEIYTYYGEYNKQEIRGHNIHLLKNDKDCTGKTIEAFEFALKYFEFNYILRTTVSTFVRLDILYKHLNNAPRVKYFSGYLVGNNPESQFISGNNMIFSKDLIEDMIINKSYFLDKNSFTDDCVISHYIIWDKKIEVYENFSRPEFSGSIDVLKGTPKNVLENHIFFRCKTGYDRMQDVEKLKYLYDIFYK